MYYLPSYNSKSCIEDNAFDDDTDLLSRVKPSQVKVSETAPGFVRAFSPFSLILSINQGIIARNKKTRSGLGFVGSVGPQATYRSLVNCVSSPRVAFVISSGLNGSAVNGLNAFA